MKISEVKAKVLQEIVDDLKRVENIAAIVLGGSHAIGMAHEQSDLDIGLYYHEDRPFNFDRIKDVAKWHETDGTSTVTGFYEWGRWVNQPLQISKRHCHGLSSEYEMRIE